MCILKLIRSSVLVSSMSRTDPFNSSLRHLVLVSSLRHFDPVDWQSHLVLVSSTARTDSFNSHLRHFDPVDRRFAVNTTPSASELPPIKDDVCVCNLYTRTQINLSYILHLFSKPPPSFLAIMSRSRSKSKSKSVYREEIISKNRSLEPDAHHPIALRVENHPLHPPDLKGRCYVFLMNTSDLGRDCRWRTEGDSTLPSQDEKTLEEDCGKNLL